MVTTFCLIHHPPHMNPIKVTMTGLYTTIALNLNSLIFYFVTIRCPVNTLILFLISGQLFSIPIMTKNHHSTTTQSCITLLIQPLLEMSLKVRGQHGWMLSMRFGTAIPNSLSKPCWLVQISPMNLTVHHSKSTMQMATTDFKI